VQRAACSVQRAACSVQRAASGLQGEREVTHSRQDHRSARLARPHMGGLLGNLGHPHRFEGRAEAVERRSPSTAKDQLATTLSSKWRHSEGMSGTGAQSPSSPSGAKLPAASTGAHSTNHPACKAWSTKDRKLAERAVMPPAPWSSPVVRACPCRSIHSTRRVARRPLGPRDLSNTCTKCPASVTTLAQVAPAMPAPNTATC